MNPSALAPRLQGDSSLEVSAGIVGHTSLTPQAGLLQGLAATTHWGVYSELEKVGAIPTAQRVVEHLDRRIITAAGVSSGIDMALRLAELLVDQTAAKAMQLMIEYDSQPLSIAAAWQKPATQ